ncbi:MAG TPA: hypothetical protein DD766_00965 [Desulfovibrio sp.]|nr:hypothetical protein [Desulfovibrio sp.]HBR05716.1 hypothetical protein [Desulfovibrio sp.]
MAQYFPFSDQASLEDQIRNLADDELLDFWEETQYLAKFMDKEQEQEEVGYNPEYERLILHELQVRTCRRGRD